jgi:thiol-disulfide isomerase/thioredoxin
VSPLVDMGASENKDRRYSVRTVSLAIALALSVVVALLLSYEMARLFFGVLDNAGVFSGSTGTGAPASKDLAFSFYDQPAELPEIRFVDGDNQPRSLSSFRGRPVLLNIWATWCVPCRKEMPSLDRLQAKFDSSQFLVLTLSIDRQGVPAVKDFYQELGLKSLGIYVDQSGEALNLVRAPGLPTTLFINNEGKEIGRKIGPAEWDNAETIALLRQHMHLPPGIRVTGALQ